MGLGEGAPTLCVALADGLLLGLHVGTREAFAVRESMPVTVGDSVSVLVSGGVERAEEEKEEEGGPERVPPVTEAAAVL